MKSKECPEQDSNLHDQRPEDFKSSVSTLPPSGLEEVLEAAPGFEPGIKDLQSHALPLGYAAESETE